MTQSSTDYELVTVLDLQICTVNSEKPIDVTVSAEDSWSVDPLTKDVNITFSNGNSVYVAGKHLVGLSKVIRQVKRAKSAVWQVPSGDKSIR